MAVNPIFYDSRETLLQALRLDKSCPGSSQEELLDQILLSVRARIFSCFGADRIAAIKSVPHTDDPVSDAEYKRTTAESMEFQMASKQAYLLLSAVFVDGGGAGLASWGDEAPYLVASTDQRLQLTDRLEVEIQQSISALGGCQSEALETPRIAIASTSNPCRPPVGRNFRDF